MSVKTEGAACPGHDLLALAAATESPSTPPCPGAGPKAPPAQEPATASLVASQQQQITILSERLRQAQELIASQAQTIAQLTAAASHPRAPPRIVTSSSGELGDPASPGLGVWQNGADGPQEESASPQSRPPSVFNPAFEPPAAHDSAAATGGGALAALAAAAALDPSGLPPRKKLKGDPHDPSSFSSVRMSLASQPTSVRSGGVSSPDGAHPHAAPLSADKMVGASNPTPSRNRGSQHKSWSEAEDAMLIMLVEEFGEQAWARIASRMMNERNNKQCRERWRNHLRPRNNKGPWTEGEDVTIMERVAQHGKKWAFISETYLPDRPDNDIKNRWHVLVRKEGLRKEAMLDAARICMRSEMHAHAGARHMHNNF